MQIYEVRQLIPCEQRVGCSQPPSSRCSPHSVHKQLGLGWEVEVDDIVQQRNVNAASSDVSDDHEVDLACAELAGVYLPGGLQCNSRHPEFTSSQAYDQLEQLSTVWFANLRAAALKRLPL